MRIWHKDLIGYLPKQQLQGQWKELYAIVGEMEKYGELKRSRGYLLVTPLNKVSKHELVRYVVMLSYLGISTADKLTTLVQRILALDWKGVGLMEDWHTQDYLKQCFYNLQEKYMCRGFGESEYNRLVFGYVKLGGIL